MNKIIGIIVTVLVVVGMAYVLNMKSDKPSHSTSPNFSHIQADVNNGAKLYDVRTNQEFTSAHFENAVNWPLQDIQASKLPPVAKDTKIYVYCQSGNRSSQAVALLKEAGYTDVIDLGGIEDVRQSGGVLKS